jgi:hypothetical protein
MKSNKNMVAIAITVSACIIVLIVALVLSRPNRHEQHRTGPTKPHSEKQKTKTPLDVRNSGNVDPSSYGGIYARNGFGQKVDWWFLIKLPNKMMDPSQIENMRLLPKDYVNNKPFGVYDSISSSMGTNYTKGYLTAGIQPSTEFIQNWAPQDNLELTLTFRSEDKDMTDRNNQNKLKSSVVNWLGLPVEYVSQLDAVPSTVTYAVKPVYGKITPATQDPADRIPSVNMWRAWLRIVHAMNLLDTSSYAPLEYNVTSLLNDPSLGSIWMNKPSSYSFKGIAYDYQACGNPKNPYAFGGGMVPDKEGIGLLQCTHCNNNGNDPANVWLEMPCNRVDRQGKQLKCWDRDTFSMLSSEIKSSLNPGVNRLNALVSMYAAANEPSLESGKLSVDMKKLKSYNEILNGPENSDSYNSGLISVDQTLFTPDGKPRYGWEKCTSAGCIPATKPSSRPKSRPKGRCCGPDDVCSTVPKEYCDAEIVNGKSCYWDDTGKCEGQCCGPAFVCSTVPKEQCNPGTTNKCNWNPNGCKNVTENYDGTMSDIRRKPEEDATAASWKSKKPKPDPKYTYNAYRRAPDCQANSASSPLTYFLPSWATVSEKNFGNFGLKHPSNPKANAPVGAGIASVINTPKRGTGVCYVYADSNNPELQYFRWVKNTGSDEGLDKSLENIINPGSFRSPSQNAKLDPLGQNKNDPVSKTLDQLFLSYNNEDTHWSFWTDQMYSGGDGYVGTARDSNVPSFSKLKQVPFDINNASKGPAPGDASETGTVYPHKGAGCSAPGAHSKGVLCYSANTGNKETNGSGFWLSTSVPMFPDISLTGMGENVRLGCQLDNNASFAQHLFCCSLDYNAMQEMLKVMKTVMACGLESPTCKVDAISGFNYGYGIHTNKITDSNGQTANAYQCSSAEQRAGPETDNLKAANSFTYDPDGESEMSIFMKKDGDNLYTTDKYTHCSNSKPCFRARGRSESRSMYVPKGDNFLAVIGKAPADNRPPWTVVAQFLESDLSVSGWWDNLNGTPSYCAGRDYKDTTNMYCLKDRRQTVERYSYLDERDEVKYNIERIMALKIPDLPNPFAPMEKNKAVSRSFTQYGKMWYVGNHAKWGISTPRNQKLETDLTSRRDEGNVPLHYVILGDMNGGGYPASKLCDANQFGRGGMFFVIENKQLWTSLANYIQLVCACNESGDASNNFCGWGGYPGTEDDPTYGRKDAWDYFAKLPVGTSKGSFWTKTDDANRDNKDWVNRAWTRYGSYDNNSPVNNGSLNAQLSGVNETIQDEDIFLSATNDLSQLQF